MHNEIAELLENDNFPKAMELLNELLNDNPDDVQALYQFGCIAVKQDKKWMAYVLFHRALELSPNSYELWSQFGRCQAENKKGWELAEYCFNKAIEIDPNNHIAYANLSSLFTQTCRPEKALEYANKSLKIKPDYNVGIKCKAFAQLMLGQWGEGWKNYEACLGTNYRRDMRYKFPDEETLPLWKGEKGKTILVHGEQGIGDEILYASCLNDIEGTVIYDTMPRLANLMKRSLNCHVIGGRWDGRIELPENVKPDCSISLAGVPIYTRRKESDFHGNPYLKADPQISLTMRALLDSLGDKPKIGIAWTGGIKATRSHLRTKTLEELYPILKQDATFISLQYKDPSEEIKNFEEDLGIKIHHFPWITEVKDYDYTAALVSELDLVISVPSSVTQLAGALGKECWVLVPEITGWLFYKKDYVWANSVKLFHNKPIKVIEEYFSKWLLWRKRNAA